MTRLTIKCRSCLVQFRLVVPDKVMTNKGPVYCVYCGAQDTFPSQDSDQDWLEVMSESFGLPGVVITMLYSAWAQAPEGMTHFRDYVQKTLREAVEQSK